MLLHLFLGTQVLEDAFIDEDRFDGSVAEDDSGSKQAVNNGDDDLYCRTVLVLCHERLTGPQVDLTYSLLLRNLLEL